MKKRHLLLLILAIPFFANSSSAQQDEWGNWIMYFGTNKVADDWSIHSEVQYRNHTVAPINIEQLLLRTGVNYHISKKAVVTVGYGYITGYDYKSSQKSPESRENRLFQQLILTNKVSRLKFEHRYRLEQRWVNDDFKNRIRYRLMVFLPLNNPTITKGTFFIGVYDEIFVNTTKTFFDRNRLYTSLGYQINKMAQVQVGYLYQRVNNFGKSYLQVGLVFNTDFRKKK
jgi:hypothetical protein